MEKHAFAHSTVHTLTCDLSVKRSDDIARTETILRLTLPESSGECRQGMICTSREGNLGSYVLGTRGRGPEPPEYVRYGISLRTAMIPHDLRIVHVFVPSPSHHGRKGLGGHLKLAGARWYTQTS